MKIIAWVIWMALGILFAQGQSSLTDSTRSLAIHKLGEALEQYYVFADKGREMKAMLLSELEAGKYRKVTEADALAARLTADIQAIYPDKHLQVYEGISSLDVYGESPDEANYFAQDQKLNFGFREVKIMPGNVGYLAFDEFSPWAEAEAAVVASLSFLERAEALILDLRENTGGAPEMVQYLGSHFLAKSEKREFSSLYFRYQDETLKFPNLKKVKGPRLTEPPLYILTSPRTGSAAESLAYDLQQMGRATLIGDTTLGGANPAKVFSLAGGLKALIAIGEAQNPITGTNWEGVGVAPDKVVGEEQAMDSAYVQALAHVAAQNEGAFGEFVSERLAREKLKAFQYQVDTEGWPEYVGHYGDREIVMKEEGLFYINHARSEQAYRLLAQPDGNFIFDASQTDLKDRPRIAFKSAGEKVTGYDLIYPSGNRNFIAKDP